MPKVDQSKVEDALGNVIDPELGMSILELQLVDKLDISPEGDVNIEYHATAAFCPPMFALKLSGDIKLEVSKVEGVRNIHVVLNGHYMSEYINQQINPTEEEKAVA